MGCHIGFLGREHGDAARTEGLFEQNKAVVRELDNPFQCDPAKPARLEGIGLVEKDLRWEEEASATGVLEQTRLLVHKLLGNLFCSAASPWRVADHKVELALPFRSLI